MLICRSLILSSTPKTLLPDRLHFREKFTHLVLAGLFSRIPLALSVWIWAHQRLRAIRLDAAR